MATTVEQLQTTQPAPLVNATPGLDTPKKSASVDEKQAQDRDNNEDSDENKNDDGGRPACFRSTAQELMFVFIATMAMAMQPILQGAVFVIPDIVGKSLHMTQAELTWLSASSPLACGAFLLFFGRIADLFGQKHMIIGSFFLFSVVALACGFVKNALLLDVLNGLLGLLSAAAVPSAQGKMSMIYGKTSVRKNKAFACFSAGNPVGFACGLVASGIATQLFGWPASYWLLAIIYILMFIAAFFCIPADDTPRRRFDRDLIQKLDVVGMLLAVSGIGMFSASLSLASDAPKGWKTDYVLALLIVGFFVIVAFIVWEKLYSHPLMPMYIWRNRNFSLLMAILTAGYMSFAPTAFFVALFFQRIWGFSALSSAVHLLPFAIAGIIVNIFAGMFMHRINNRLLMFAGALSYTIAFMLLALNRTSSSYWSFCFPSFILTVIGADLEFNVTNMYVMSSLPDDQQGIAGGLFQTITRLFTTIGLGVITAVFNAVSKNPSLGGYWAAYPEVQPYSAAFWYGTATAGVSVGFVFFLTIGTQGGKPRTQNQA